MFDGPKNKDPEEKIFMGEYVVMKLTENLWGKMDELEKNL
jgi:hypothetical protein